MTQVLVVEFDETLRSALHDLLTQVGHYAVTELSEEAAALDHLAAAREGAVAICSNRDADHHRSAAFFAKVAAGKRLRTSHRYIMLSTSPEQIPDSLRAHLAQLNAPILAKPFDVDALLTVVRQAEQRLTRRSA